MSNMKPCRHAGCDKEFKTGSGRWKHEKKCEFRPQETEQTQESTVEEIPVEETPMEGAEPVMEDDSSSLLSSTPSADETPPPSASSKWQSFDMGFDSSVTEAMPAPLKMMAKPSGSGKKLTKQEAKAQEDLNIVLLKSGLTMLYGAMTKYGQAALLDDDFTVQHSENDKNMVAGAQWRYLKSKGIIPSNVVNEGVLAAGMTLWYVSPTYKIVRKSKVAMLKGRLGFLQKIPLIGRLFGRKKNKKVTLNDFAPKGDEDHAQ